VSAVPAGKGKITLAAPFGHWRHLLKSEGRKGSATLFVVSPVGSRRPGPLHLFPPSPARGARPPLNCAAIFCLWLRTLRHNARARSLAHSRPGAAFPRSQSSNARHTSPGPENNEGTELSNSAIVRSCVSLSLSLLHFTSFPWSCNFSASGGKNILFAFFFAGKRGEKWSFSLPRRGRRRRRRRPRLDPFHSLRSPPSSWFLFSFLPFPAIPTLA